MAKSLRASQYLHHHSSLEMRYKFLPYPLRLIQRIDAMKKSEELRFYGNEVMAALTVLLNRSETGSKVLVLRPRGTAWLVPTLKVRAYLSCSGPNASQVVRQQLTREDNDDPGFELTP